MVELLVVGMWMKNVLLSEDRLCNFGCLVAILVNVIKITVWHERIKLAYLGCKMNMRSAISINMKSQNYWKWFYSQLYKEVNSCVPLRILHIWSSTKISVIICFYIGFYGLDQMQLCQWAHWNTRGNWHGIQRIGPSIWYCELVACASIGMWTYLHFRFGRCCNWGASLCWSNGYVKSWGSPGI